MIAIVVSRADSASEHIGEHLLDLADWAVREDDARPDAEGGGTYYRLAGSPDAGASGDPTGRGAGDQEPFELRTFDDLHLDLEDAAAAFGPPNAAAGDAPDGSAVADAPGGSETASASGDSGAPESRDSPATDDAPDAPDLLVFVSRHSGETGPLLTAHFTGNFGPAEYGGEPGALAAACPNAHAALLAGFEEYAPDGYEVGMECTHHGPSSVGAPALFAELGSGEAEWDDPAGARAVARAVLDLGGVAAHRDRQLVGFGGGHYAPRFERVQRDTDWAVGHVAADWALDAMGDPGENRDVLRRAFERSRADRALLDGDHSELEAVLADLGYAVVSETWVRETDGVPLDLVASLEADLASVDEGLRFGDPAHDPAGVADGGGDYRVVDLPDDLLAEAQGIDPEATREAVAARALAFGTEQAGTRARGRAAVREAADRDALVDALADVLAEKYDEVAREDGAVVARTTGFDPEKARERGVPEGPKFGTLSAGDSVTVDGEAVEPEAVESERVHEFPV